MNKSTPNNITRVVVLAAGKGTRMNSNKTSKVLLPFRGKPIIQHLLDAIVASGVDSRPVVVVGHEAQAVQFALGARYDYVLQEEQLGTGHAVLCVKTLLEGYAKDIIVLYGDHPMVSAQTIAKLEQLHHARSCVLTMMTSTVPDFKEWRAPFYDFGRVVRNGAGDIVEVVEKKDATSAQLEIKEVNPSFFCFNASWLWKNLEHLDNKNAKGEYYLTDLVRIAISGGECIASMDISPLESIGVNTPEHLELAKLL